MPRKPRIDFLGAWHHVMHRGARREAIFRQDDDCLEYLAILADTVESFEIELHAYALMPNHYHLLIRSVHGNLSRAMRYLNATYTQWYNRSHRYDGPLFRGRFHSQLILEEQHLPYLLAYIHLNPLRANLVTKLTSDCWTSHLAYMGRSASPNWLSREFFLELLGGEKPLHRYVHALHMGRRSWPDELALHTGWITSPESKGNKARTQHQKWGHDGEVVLEDVCRVADTTITHLRRSQRGPAANPARRFAVFALRKYTPLTHKEIGKTLSMSEYQVANVLRRYNKNEEPFRDWNTQIARRLND